MSGKMNRMMGRAISACLLGCFLLNAQLSIVKAEMPTAKGIWRSSDGEYKLSQAHEDLLLNSLRKITGLRRLSFTGDGSLSSGEPSSPAGGSGVAREILSRILRSGKVFIIEDHSGSPTVNFGQMDEGMNYENLISRQKLDIWRVRLDFDDFIEMEAPDEVRASFNAGFTMLHELLHGVGYRDAHAEDDVGECEELINRVRTELRLPVRDQYFGEPVQLAPQVVSVRLRFRKENIGIQRIIGERHMYLFFLLPKEKEKREREIRENMNRSFSRISLISGSFFFRVL